MSIDLKAIRERHERWERDGLDVTTWHDAIADIPALLDHIVELEAKREKSLERKLYWKRRAEALEQAGWKLCAALHDAPSLLVGRASQEAATKLQTLLAEPEDET